MALENKFREKFKYYKQRQPAPSLNAVVNPHNPEQQQCFFTSIPPPQSLCEEPPSPDLAVNPSSSWQLFASRLSPGFTIITGALSPEQQFYWARRCLADFSQRPNRRNLDAVCPNIGDWFSEAMMAGRGGGGIIDKLRWSTMGYHHNWDTKACFGIQ
jgi:alkylated DNA repair protein alkB family protein 1